MVKPFADVLLDRLATLVSEDSIFVSKIAVSALSSFSIVTNYNASKYFKRVFPTLVLTFKQKHQRSIVFCSRLIEAISISAFYSEETDFKEALPDIKYILKYFESVIPSLEDQRVSYLLAAWNRLVTRLKQSAEEFSEYLCSILVRVLGQCDEYKAHSTKKRSLLEADLYVSPYEIDYFQVKSGLRLLSSALVYMNLGLQRLESTFDRLMQSCLIAASFIPDEEVSIEATTCLEKMLKIVMKKDFIKFSLLFKSCQGLILDRVNDYQMKNSHRKLTLCSNVCKLATNLVKIPIYDSEAEINACYSVLLSIMRRGLFIISCIEKKIHGGISNAEEAAENEQVEPLELEPQEIADLNTQKQAELDSLKQILTLIGKLVKIHPSISTSLCEDLFVNLFQKLLDEKELIVSWQFIVENSRN
jgi:hypothetical protein